MSARVSLEETSIRIGRLSKDCPHQCRWALANLLRAQIEQKDGGKATLLFFFSLSDIDASGLGLLNLDQDSCHWPHGSQAFGLRQGYTNSFPEFPGADGSSWEFPGLRNHMS